MLEHDFLDKPEQPGNSFECDYAEAENIAKQMATKSAQWNYARHGFKQEDAVEGEPGEHTEWKPHFILTTWENDDAIRCITVLVALTGGTVDRSTDGISVDLDDDGNVLCVSEVWPGHTQDMNLFYSHIPKKNGESEDDFTRRRFQMATVLRKMKDKYGDADGNMYSLFRQELPFRVEPTEKQITFIGDKVGGRYLHIDLIEKKLQEVHGVLLIDDESPVHKGLVTPSGGRYNPIKKQKKR